MEAALVVGVEVTPYRSAGHVHCAVQQYINSIADRTTNEVDNAHIDNVEGISNCASVYVQIRGTSDKDAVADGASKVIGIITWCK